MHVPGYGLSLVTLILLALSAQVVADGTIYVNCKNYHSTYEYPYASAQFGPGINPNGVNGLVFESQLQDGCESVIPSIGGKPVIPPENSSWMVLIKRGGNCTFEQKVLNAQNAGADVAIIYDDRMNGKLVPMGGSGKNVKIPSIFVNLETGQSIRFFIESDCKAFITIFPGPSLITIHVLTVAFLCIVGICAILSIVLLFRRARLRTVVFAPTSDASPVPTETDAFEEDGTSMLFFRKCGVSSASDHMSKNENAQEDDVEKGLSDFCSICIEDLTSQNRVISLPCSHIFHEECIYAWIYGKLAERKTVDASLGKVYCLKKDACCPLCKRIIKQMLEVEVADTSAPLSATREANENGRDPNGASDESSLGEETTDSDDEILEIATEPREVEKDSEGEKPEGSEATESQETDFLLRR